MKSPLFSIITACYNDGAKLKSSVESVLDQNISAELMEYVVIDGASGQETINVLTELDFKYNNEYSNAHSNNCQNTPGASPNRFRYISESDSGLYDALNKGLKLARGEYIIILGAGDTLRAGALRVIADKIKSVTGSKEPLPDLIYGDVWYQKTRAVRGGGPHSFERLVQFNLCHQGMVVRRESAIECGGFDLRFRIAADLAHTYRLFGLKNFYSTYVPEVIAEFEQDGIGDESPDPDWFQVAPVWIGEHLGHELEKTYRLSGRRFDDLLRHIPGGEIILVGDKEDCHAVTSRIESRCQQLETPVRIMHESKNDDEQSLQKSPIVICCDSKGNRFFDIEKIQADSQASHILRWPGYIYDESLMQNLELYQKDLACFNSSSGSAGESTSRGPLVLFGAGWMCESLIYTLRKKGWGDLIAGVLDNFATTESLFDLPLYKPDSLEGQKLLANCGRVIISNGWPQMMRKQFQGFGVPKDKILSLWGA